MHFFARFPQYSQLNQDPSQHPGNAIAEKAAASTETAPPAAADAKHLASEPAPEAEALARAKEEARATLSPK